MNGENVSRTENVKRKSKKWAFCFCHAPFYDTFPWSIWVGEDMLECCEEMVVDIYGYCDKEWEARVSLMELGYNSI